MIKKRELRKNIIEDKIKDIIDSISLVEENFPSEFSSFKQLGLAKDGIYKKIEFSIESIINICYIINADLRLGAPEEEDDIFENLETNKIFNAKILELIKKMKKFRNILVHKYGKIDDKKAFEDIQEGLKDFEAIIKEIEKFIKQH